MSGNRLPPLFAAVKAIVFLGSSVYLLGLLIIAADAEAYGRAILTPDATLPYEIALLFAFICFLILMFAHEIVKIGINTRKNENGAKC